MRLPPLNLAPETLTGTYGVYHLTRLKADPKMKELAAAFEAAQNRLEERVAAQKKAFEACQIAMAVRDGEDDALDTVIGAFASAALGPRRNYKAPLYLKYFQEGMGAIVSAPLEEELRKAGVILARLAEEEDEALKAHAGVISAAMDTLSMAMDAHRAALDAEIQMDGLVKTEKTNWLDAYKKSYRDLGRVFYKDPKQAEKYFKPSPRGKKDNGGDTPPAG